MPTKNRTLGTVLLVTTTTVYTTPPRFESNVDSIVISNTSTSSVKFTLEWYDPVLTTTYYIAKDVTLYPNSILQLTDSMILQPNDLLRGLATVADAVNVIVKVKEEYLTAP